MKGDVPTSSGACREERVMVEREREVRVLGRERAMDVMRRSDLRGEEVGQYVSFG